MEEGRINREQETLSVRLKDFWDVTPHNVAKLLSPEFAHSVAHEIDGLIFQPVPDVSRRHFFINR